MGETSRQRALAVAAVFHGVLAGAWFVLGVLVPGAASLRDGLLLVPTFVATGVLTLTDAALTPDAWRHLAWAAAFLDLLGVPPLALYVARLVLARESPAAGEVRWTPGANLDTTIAALVLLSLTGLAHLYTIIVALRYVYKTKKGGGGGVRK
jgi:uncharacterized protein (DUF983 family)